LLKKYTPLLTILIQFASALIVLFIIYIIFALLDVDDPDLINAVGFMIFQPLFGIIITLATIAACFIVGIPLRFIPKLKAWWVSKPYLPLIGIVVGIILLILSLIPGLMHPVKIIIDGEEKVKQIPNGELMIAGWLSTGFFLLHFYPFSFIAWILKEISIRKQKRYSSSLND
jgi:hypothetical protein